MDDKRTKVIVTGGAGFIGHHLVKKLINAGKTVYLVDDQSSAVIQPLTWQEDGISVREILPQMLEYYDIESDTKKPQIIYLNCDYSSLSVIKLIDTGNIGTVFHLAAKPRVEWSVQNPVISTTENFVKVLPLLRVCAENKTRFVFSSTAAVYGDVKVLPTMEDDATMPNSPYGLAKLCVEKYMHLFEDLYGLDWVSLRYFNVYGPAQPGDSPYSTVVSAWCCKALAGEPLRSDGDGEQTRDMVHVDDVVNANITVARKSMLPHRVFNVGSGKSLSNNCIRQKFVEKGYTEVQHSPERAGDVKDTLANINRLESIGWKAETSFNDGIQQVFEYWNI